MSVNADEYLLNIVKTSPLQQELLWRYRPQIISDISLCIIIIKGDHGHRHPRPPNQI